MAEFPKGVKCLKFTEVNSQNTCPEGQKGDNGRKRNG